MGSPIYPIRQNMQKTKQIGIRLESGDLTLLRRLCESRGEDMSDFVRRSIRKEMANLGFLNAADRKALGLDPVMPTARFLEDKNKQRTHPKNGGERGDRHAI